MNFFLSFAQDFLYVLSDRNKTYHNYKAGHFKSSSFSLVQGNRICMDVLVFAGTARSYDGQWPGQMPFP
jgi:hypothetical protein